MQEKKYHLLLTTDMSLVKFGIGVQQSYLKYNQEFFCQMQCFSQDICGGQGGRGKGHTHIPPHPQHGAVVTTTHLHSRKPEHRFSAGSNHTMQRFAMVTGLKQIHHHHQNFGFRDPKPPSPSSPTHTSKIKNKIKYTGSHTRNWIHLVGRLNFCYIFHLMQVFVVKLFC